MHKASLLFPSGGVENFHYDFRVGNLLDLQSRKQTASAAVPPAPAPAPSAKEMVSAITTDSCLVHPDQAVQFFCVEPACQQQVICALCLVQSHVQHKVELIKTQKEKIVQEVTKMQQEEQEIIREKIGCVLSIKDKITKNGEKMTAQIEKRVQAYHQILRQIEQCLKQTLEEKTAAELQKVEQEVTSLQNQLSQLDAIECEGGSPMTHLLRVKGALQQLRTAARWEFSCDLPVLIATPFPPTLFLGEDPSLTTIEAVRESAVCDSLRRVSVSLNVCVCVFVCGRACVPTCVSVCASLCISICVSRKQSVAQAFGFCLCYLFTYSRRMKTIRLN